MTKSNTRGEGGFRGYGLPGKRQAATTFAYTLVVLAAATSLAVAEDQTIAMFGFDAGSLSSSVTPANLTISNATPGTGVYYTNCYDTISWHGPTYYRPESEPVALDNQVFYAFTVAPADGYKMNFSGFSLDASNANVDTIGWFLYSSVGNTDPGGKPDATQPWSSGRIGGEDMVLTPPGTFSTRSLDLSARPQFQELTTPVTFFILQTTGWISPLVTDNWTLTGSMDMVDPPGQPHVLASPASGSNIDLGYLAPSQVGGADCSISNDGTPGSVLNLTGHSVTGSSLFSISNWEAVNKSLLVDQSTSPKVAFAGTDIPGTYTADITVHTDAGDVIHHLKAAVVYPGDANLDGSVAFSDYQVLEANFGNGGRAWSDGDFNGDGSVNFADYQILETNFGKSTPEPATLSLLILGGLALLRRRR